MERFRGGVVATLAIFAVASCGNPAPTATPTARKTPTAIARPSAAAGPCASVTTTTAIAEVPPACAALWAPYGVTKVPPANLTDSTPSAPPVVNGTNGAVSDADAQAWALAANRTAVWYRWAEANDQPSLLGRLGHPSLLPPAELQVLATNGTVAQPDCAIFPTKVALFAIDTEANRFFTSVGQIVSGGFALAAKYPGPCTITSVSASGQVQTIASFPQAGVTFFAGAIRDDALLGRVWFTVGAGNCAQRGAPTAWCR